MTESTPTERIAGIATLHSLDVATTTQYARCVCTNGEHRDASHETRWASRDWANAGGARGSHLVTRTLTTITSPAVEAS